MAKRIVPIGAIGTALGLFAVLFAGTWPLLRQSAGGQMLPADWAALRFTLWQALLSALICCALAMPLARALSRRSFWGRSVLIRLLSAPFILPSMAAILGLLAVFGRQGPISALLDWAGMAPLPIFGLGGVLLAHVFLNLPLAIRMLLQGWAAIPSERFRLAQNLGFGPYAIFRHLELPMLRSQIPSIFAAIFMICLTSFAVALILGGGPRASTVELGLYQSLRFDFNLNRAAMLALLQIALCVAAIALVALVWRPAPFGAGLDRAHSYMGARGTRGLDAAIIICAALFLLMPLAMIVVRGAQQLADMPSSFLPAAVRSVFVALAAAALGVGAALALALARARGAGLWCEVAAMLPLGTSSLALGTGLFLATRAAIAPQSLTLPLAIVLNAIMALPFLYRMLLPACSDAVRGYGRLSNEIGLTPLAQLRWVFLPRLARNIGFCFGLAAAMSMGDFGVVALFATPAQTTLPVLIGQMMGAYQMELAAAMTLWLVLLSLLIFWIFDYAGARYAKD
jgi:thiamine transport system permease protein